jgi:hypothetical protein
MHHERNAGTALLAAATVGEVASIRLNQGCSVASVRRRRVVSKIGSAGTGPIQTCQREQNEPKTMDTIIVLFHPLAIAPRHQYSNT